MMINKKRLASAVAGALAIAPVAFAQAEVSIYGIADVAISNLDYGQSGTKSFLTSDAGSGGSRLGFNASMDLENGLTVKGNLEAGISFDNPGGSDSAGDTDNTLFNTRQAWVGLSGNFGSINAGKDYSLSFLAASRGEYCGWCGIASPAALTQQGVRTGNYLKYDSPDFSGFTFGIAKTFGEDTSTTNDVGDGTEFAVFYSVDSLNFAASTRTVNGTAGNDATDSYIAGNYDFGGFKIYALLGGAENDTGTLDESYTNLGVSFKVGEGDLNLQLAETEGDTGPDASTTMTAISYFTPIGKDTTFYIQVASIDNEANAARAPWPGGGAQFSPAAGVDPDGVQIGVKYNF